MSAGREIWMKMRAGLIGKLQADGWEEYEDMGGAGLVRASCGGFAYLSEIGESEDDFRSPTGMAGRRVSLQVTGEDGSCLMIIQFADLRTAIRNMSFLAK